jgi:predicted enzyme related to lactoylglutathione lyase
MLMRLAVYAASSGRGLWGNDMSESPTVPVYQLRLVVHVDDFDEVLRFYRDVLGLPVEQTFSNGPGAQGAILDAGRATLEIFNAAQKAAVDDLEVGRQVAPRIRVAFQVDDTRATAQRLVEAGATEVAAPTVTPWNSVNARLDAPGGLHITVFQEQA